SASVGSASGGRASGSASVGSASVGGATGSASVGSARPVSPAGGRATVAGKRRAGRGGPDGPLGEDELKEQKKLKKKRRRRKVYAGLIAVGVLFVAAITIVGTWFYQDVPALSDLRQEGEPTLFTYADGETEAAAYGEAYRKQVKDPANMPETVKHALIASEDRKFYDHGGVDYAGTMRALFNNVTGGSTQGASTITQQLAGIVAGIRDEISYDRKAREAVMAMKLEQEYTKDEIITYYLDMAYFGRGAYGVAAASELYFDLPVEELDHAQAAFIIMQVKSPNGYYDPYYTDAYDEAAAVDRWEYVMGAMVGQGFLSQAESDALAYPEPTADFEGRGSWGGDEPLGFITNEIDGYVYQELQERYGLSKEELKGAEEDTGGYKVVLSIDKEIQAQLELTADRGEIKVDTDEDGNYLNDAGEIVDSIDAAKKDLTDDGYWQFENTNEEAALAGYDPSMMTAMVAVEPGTGRVLGYYGGPDGFGIDKAGNESPHPPSSTMKMITAATAIEEGASIESWWDASSPRAFETLELEESESCIGSGTYPNCTLRNGGQDSEMYLTLTDAVRDSKNTPMYAIAEDYGVDTILKNAIQMGLTEMSQTVQLYDAEGNPHDVPVTYRLYPDFTYTVHGQTATADGEWVTDPATGGIDNDAPVAVEGNSPQVDTEGRLLAAENGEPEHLDIGGGGATDPFYYHLSFGQYPTSVRDMAAMYATIANDGTAVETHYVDKVFGPDGQEVQPTRDLVETQALDSGVARDLQWVGSEIDGGSSAGTLDRDFFGKTGTWEASGKDKDGNDYPDSYNAHAWYVGAIPQLSIATWVGNVTSESDPISDPDGNYDNVFGGNTSYPVWYSAMDRVLEAKGDNDGWEPKDWEGKVTVGSPITTDIEEVNGHYCGKNPADPRCSQQQEEEEQEEESCEDGGTGPECEDQGGDTGPGPGEGDESSDPGDGDESPDPGDDDGNQPCGGFMQPPCDDTETPTAPEEGGGGQNHNQ
ncbi:MAG TPA: transglycosylase domain-containing protein, partial [Glycomyces sp.]|nr:transglycosylase domain-containing protein [Glycomyces sp.]